MSIVRPEIIGELGPAVGVGLDVIEDVFLTDAHMLKQVPERVVAIGRAGVDMLWGETGHGVLEVHVRLPDGEHTHQLVAQDLVVVHFPYPLR